MQTPAETPDRQGARPSHDSSRPTSPFAGMAGSSVPSTPVFAPYATDGAPTAAGMRSRRASSIMSGVSSLSGFHGQGLVSISPGPAGLKVLAASQNRLGHNSIADLINGAPNSRSDDPLGSPVSSPAPMGRQRQSHQLHHPPAVSSLQPFKPPTTKDIPPVTLAPTPRVKREELNEHLSNVAAEYETFHATRLMRKNSYQSNEDAVSVLSAAVSTLSQPLTEDESDAATSQFTQLPGAIPDLTSLSTIPDVFFQEKFQLDNPKIFGIVSEKSRHVGGQANEDTEDIESASKFASNPILQEKLSWYIDTVELHLINEISNASQSFFSTLNDLKTIRQQASKSIDTIGSLKQQLLTADDTIAIQGIQQVKLRQRQKNVDILSQSLEQVSTLFKKAVEAESYLETNSDISKCLDTIDSTEALLAGDSSDPEVKAWTANWLHPICDLRSVPGLADLRDNLCTLRSRAGDSYSAAFLEILLQDLRNHADGVEKYDTLARLGRVLDRGSSSSSGQTFNMSYLTVDQVLRESLTTQLYGLARADNLASAFQHYKEAVTKMAKNVVRVHLPSNSDTGSISSSATGRSIADKGASLATSLRNMTKSEAEDMVADIYADLSELFRRISTQQKLLLDLTSSLEVPSGSKAVSAVDLSDLLLSVVSNSENRMFKVLKVRREQVVNLDVQSFISFYTLNGIYLAECEAVCGDTSSDLRTLLNQFIRQFMESFHRNSERSLVALMERDLWREEEISREFQALVDTIVASAETDPEAWMTALRVAIRPPATIEATGPDGRKLPKNVFVENESFIISNGAIELVKRIEDYMKLLVLIPHVAGEITGKMLELIRTFNSKAAQLILRAGATRSAGLKHITVKHLSLSSESVHIMMALLPFIKRCVGRHVKSQVLLEDFETVGNELEGHRQEIHQKFLSLMNDKMTAHCIQIEKLDWSTTEDPANKYIRDLVKETTTLVKILAKILPKQSYLLIVSQIFDNYKRRLLESYMRIDIKTPEMKRNILKDVEYFRENVSDIEGSGNAAEVVKENINAIPVPEPKVSLDIAPAKPPRPSAEKVVDTGTNDSTDNDETKDLESRKTDETTDNGESPTANADGSASLASEPSDGSTNELPSANGTQSYRADGVQLEKPMANGSSLGASPETFPDATPDQTEAHISKEQDQDESLEAKEEAKEELPAAASDDTIEKNESEGPKQLLEEPKEEEPSEITSDDIPEKSESDGSKEEGEKEAEEHREELKEEPAEAASEDIPEKSESDGSKEEAQKEAEEPSEEPNGESIETASEDIPEKIESEVSQEKPGGQPAGVPKDEPKELTEEADVSPKEGPNVETQGQLEGDSLDESKVVANELNEETSEESKVKPKGEKKGGRKNRNSRKAQRKTR